MKTAADGSEHAPQLALNGLQGRNECFERLRLAGSLFCVGVDKPGDIEGRPQLQEAFEMGKRV